MESQQLLWALIAVVLPILAVYILDQLKKISSNQLYQAFLVSLSDEGKKIWGEMLTRVQKALEDGVLEESEKAELKKEFIERIINSKDAIIKTLAPKVYEEILKILLKGG